MGTGIDAARADAPEHAQLLDNLKDQLLIVLIARLGGVVDIPVDEIDGTGDSLMTMSVDDQKVFHFKLKKKT